MALASTRRLPRTLAPPRRLPVRAILGLALAITAVAMVYTLNRSTQPQTTGVLRATRDVPLGAIVRAGDLEAVSEALPDDVARTLVSARERDSLVGRRVSQPLNAGELVSRRQVQAPARQIPAGQRVYTIPVSPEAAAGGQAVDVGDQVEVVVTLDKSQPDQARTLVVLPRATVYQVGRADASTSPLGSGQAGSADSRLTSLTLLLDSDSDYQAIARARWIGELDVAVLGRGEAN